MVEADNDVASVASQREIFACGEALLGIGEGSRGGADIDKARLRLVDELAGGRQVLIDLAPLALAR